GPRNHIIRLIELECAKNPRPEVRPYAIQIVVISDSFQRAQADLVSTALVTQQVAPAADFDLPTVGGLPVARRTGAAHDQYSHPRIFASTARRSCQRGFQIMRRVARDAGPDLRGGGLDSARVLAGPCAGQSDGNAIRSRQLDGESSQMRDELLV